MLDDADVTLARLEALAEAGVGADDLDRLRCPPADVEIALWGGARDPLLGDWTPPS